MLQPAQGLQILEAFVDAGDDVAVADRDENATAARSSLSRRRSLLPDFKRGGLFAFGGEGVVAGVAAVPAKFLRGLARSGRRPGRNCHPPGSPARRRPAVGPPWPAGRVRGAKMTAGWPTAAAMPARAAPALPVEAVTTTSAPICAGARHHHRAGAVLEGGGRVAALVFDPQPCCRPSCLASSGGLVDRRPAGGVQRGAFRRPGRSPAAAAGSATARTRSVEAVSCSGE